MQVFGLPAQPILRTPQLYFGGPRQAGVRSVRKPFLERE